MQHKASPGFSIFTPGDLHTINLEDFPPSATVFFFLRWYYMKCTGKLGRGGRAGWKKVSGASGASKGVLSFNFLLLSPTPSAQLAWDFTYLNSARDEVSG
jgi:hypothetical protein